MQERLHRENGEKPETQSERTQYDTQKPSTRLCRQHAQEKISRS